MKFSLSILIIFLTSCKSRYAGFIPVHTYEYILTNKEREFELEEIIKGTLIRFQPSYDCTIDSIAYNSTALIQMDNGDTVTVYSPCQQQELIAGIPITVEKPDTNGRRIQKNKREIIEQFPKQHLNYSKWEYISCKYPNTVGRIITR